MFIFILHQMHELVDAMFVVGGLGHTFELKFSEEGFSIMANSTLSTPTPSIIALQLFPPFFSDYLCLQHQYSLIVIDQFYPILFDLERSGYSTLTFYSAVSNLAKFTLEAPNRNDQEMELPMFPSDGMRDVREFDWSTFVSINSEEFISLVMSLYNFDHVRVRLTSTQVVFLCSRMEIVFTTERKQCIIGGVAPTNEVDFGITLHPIVNMCDIASRAKRVWLFKSTNSSRGVMSAPIGLHARFLAYFPGR